MANNEKDMKNLFNQLDELLGASDIKDVSAESSGFAQLKNGYYLCEVKKAELKPSKSSGKLMVAFQLKVVEDGTDFTFDAKSRPTPVTLKGTKIARFSSTSRSATRTPYGALLRTCSNSRATNPAFLF